MYDFFQIGELVRFTETKITFQLLEIITDREETSSRPGSTRGERSKSLMIQDFDVLRGLNNFAAVTCFPFV